MENSRAEATAAEAERSPTKVTFNEDRNVSPL